MFLGVNMKVILSPEEVLEAVKFYVSKSGWLPVVSLKELDVEQLEGEGAYETNLTGEVAVWIKEKE
jgi:hypothetical protein